MADLAGQTFSRWTVISPAGTKGYEKLWLCRCDCGTERVLKGLVLRHGKSKSCGCLRREVTARRSTKHGHATGGVISPTYHSWAGMIARCTNPNHKHFHHYGGRGITVDQSWLESFPTFLADMGEKPDGTSIEREDRNGPYSKSNCVWATAEVQARNKSTNHTMTLDGRTQTMGEWAEELGIHPATLSDRTQNGWSDDAALATPVVSPDNNVRSILVTSGGETLTVAEWCRRLNLKPGTVYMRIWRGREPSRALNLS